MQLPADGDLVYPISGYNPGAYSGTCHMADVEQMLVSPNALDSNILQSTPCH